MLGFESIGSAIIIAYDGDPILTTDAWINDSAYFGSWAHDYEIPRAQMDAITRAKFHWFSHGHPDHLNVESLPALSGGQFLLSDHFGGRIRRDVEGLGYNVCLLKDWQWMQLSDRIRICSAANHNQDSILLIEIGKTLVINANDSPDYGASMHIRRIAKNYENVYFCALNGWGGADMLNLFDATGRKLTDVNERRRAIAPRAQRSAMVHGAQFAIPFSGFHRYQREDSAWANTLIPELDDYLTDPLPTGPQMLPAFIRVNAENGDITKIHAERNPLELKKPEAFGDNWSDPMVAEDVAKIDAYFKAREHLAGAFGFIEVILGGKSHVVDLNPGRRDRGISLEAPRNSFMTCVEHQIFDDLLIGNYMKVTLHGTESLYPDFSPYVAKYGDNGQARSRRELRRYFLHYLLRDPIALTLQQMSTNSEWIFRAVVPSESALFKRAKKYYYQIGSRRR